MPDSTPAVPRLTYLRIKNYRALRDVEFRDLTPLTVLIGPNGSGKSTVLDALDFLAEAMRGNLVQAWEKRNRFQGMRTRGNNDNIRFEIEASGIADTRKINYSLEIAQHDDGRLFIMDEKLKIIGKEQIELAFFQELRGNTEAFGQVTKEFVSEKDNLGIQHYTEKSSSSSTVILTAYDYWRPHPLLFLKVRISSSDDLILINLLKLLSSYSKIHLTDDHLKGYSDAGPREKLSPNGDNLPNVLYYLHEKHPAVLEKITAQLRRWIPQLADVVPEITSDERLLLRFKDAAFEKPLPAQYMSGGTMRLAALLTLLYEPGAAGLLGIEEPENELHPQLLPYLAEELIAASEHRQLLVVTHAPFLLDALDPAQVWILHRDADGYTQATRTADIPNVPELVEDGSPLGYLWTSNSLPGSPLAPRPHAR